MGFAPDGCYRSLQFIGSATLLQPRTIRAANLLMAISLSLGIANAQCPAAGADTTCGAIITVTDAGASILYTGQGPYDGFDDIGSATLLQPRTIRAANLLMAISLSLGIANAE